MHKSKNKNINKFKSLNQKLKSKIFDQDEAIDSLVNYINISAAGLNDKEKPIGSFLFTGPTGVGKTELAKQLSIELGIHFERFDMSEFSTQRSADNLIGGAAGLVGYDEGGLLTNAILENPNCVLLFDEIEKADKSVLNKFLQIMDYGKLTSSKGEKVFFNNTIVIFTSNLNAIKTVKRTAGFGSSSYVEYENSMDEFLAPEFRARINQIVQFNSLNNDTSKMIIKKYFEEISQMLSNKDIKVEPSDSFINKLIETSDVNLGARDLQNLITQNVKVIVSQEIISGNLQNDSIITFDYIKEKDEYKYYFKRNPKSIEAPSLFDFNDIYFEDAIEAQNYAKNNPGSTITRSACGNGYIVKQ